MGFRYDSVPSVSYGKPFFRVRRLFFATFAVKSFLSFWNSVQSLDPRIIFACVSPCPPRKPFF